MTGLFSQLVMLGSSGMLLTALIVLWRRGLPAYIAAYRWQSWLLAAVVATIAHFGDDTSLYWVAGALLVLKGIAIPALLGAMRRRVGVTPQVTPFVNTETSLLVASLLVSYSAARPFFLSPGVPSDRVRILREAATKTVKDSEFLAEAEKTKRPIDPLSGVEMEAMYKEALELSPRLKALWKELLGR